MTRKPWKPTIQYQAGELMKDLEELYVEHPRGIPMSTISEYYGCNQVTAVKVCQYLADGGRVEFVQAKNNIFYLYPKEVQKGLLISPLQELCLEAIKGIAGKQHEIVTTYAAISQRVDRAPCGVRNAIIRLHTMGLVKILASKGRGNPNGLTLQIPGEPSREREEAYFNQNLAT